jgi:hypothetical protein
MASMPPEGHGSALRVRLRAARSRAQERRDEAAPVHAESGQAVHPARAVQEQSNVLLETAASIVAGITIRRGFTLPRPVTAMFHMDAHGSTGIDVTVRLEDPRKAAAATAALHEHFGLDAGSADVIRVA